MNPKNDAPEYVFEEVDSKPWVRSKAGILTATIVGGVLALGAAFGTGVAVGSEFGHGGPGIASFDREGDHKFDSKFPDGEGQHPPRPNPQND